LTVIKFVGSHVETDNLANYNMISIVLWRLQTQLHECRKWENDDDLLHRLATNVKKTHLIKRHPAFTFESVHVRRQQIYEYCMVAIISTIFIMMHHALSYKWFLQF